MYNTVQQYAWYDDTRYIRDGRPGGLVVTLECFNYILLIAFILEFESHRGDILHSNTKKKKGINCRERLARVGASRRESTSEERAQPSSRRNARHSPYIYRTGRG